MNIKKLTLLFSLFLYSGCGFLSDSGPRNNLLVTGLIGSALGAGIGTAIGAGLSNGDIGDSALLGTAIGFGVGTIGVYAYREYAEWDELRENDTLIEENRLMLKSAQAEVDNLRAEVYGDSKDFIIDKSRVGEVYDGPSLGTYYR